MSEEKPGPPPGYGPITSFPAEGLKNSFRHIVGHNKEGKAYFKQSDHGDHHSDMVNGGAFQNIIYSFQSPLGKVDLNEDKDVKYATENCPPLFVPQGCVVRMIDFSPGAESNMHRAVALGFGTVCEGVVELSLDSGEKRVMRPGDVSINRAGNHKWRNTSTTEPARMLYFMFDVEPVMVNGKQLEFEMGYLADEYPQN
ncbi:MAG: hypothetical protein Q9162_007526 [Coniocarpon cinnabarinum]